MMRITAIDRTRASFINSFASLSNEVAESAIDALVDLLKMPQPARLRLHRLQGYKNPKVYTIDITANKSHKISFELVETVAVLRKAGTHKTLDRSP